MSITNLGASSDRNRINAHSSQSNSLINEVSPKNRRDRSSWLGKLWNAISMAYEHRHEPVFWQKRNCNGDIYWEGYDSAHNQTIYFTSEDEARIWLDCSSPFQ